MVAKRARFRRRRDRVSRASPRRAITFPRNSWSRPDGTRTICRRRFSSVAAAQRYCDIIKKKMTMVNRAIPTQSWRGRCRVDAQPRRRQRPRKK